MDRPPFMKKGKEFDDARKFFEHLSPDQQQKFLENFERWQGLTPEERRALRDREESRRQKILAEIDQSIAQTGLHLDRDARELYVLRYTQERRKIEIKLQKEMDEKRKPLLEDMNKRLKQEFQAAASPSPSATPAASPTSTQAPETSPTPAS